MLGRTQIKDMKKLLEGVNDVKENTLTIDIMDILDTLESYEVDNGIIYDKEEETDYEYYIDDYLEIGLDEGWIEERNANNTYNWGAPLINDINFEIYYDNHEREYIVRFRIHCGYGDIRVGYSEWMYLSFSYEEEFLEVLLECSKTIEVKLDDEIYYIDINPLNDNVSLLDKNYEEINGAAKYDLLDKMEELNLVTY